MRYKVYFTTYHGYTNNGTDHPAGSFDNIGEAIECAKQCYGYIKEDNRIIRDYRIS